MGEYRALFDDLVRDVGSHFARQYGLPTQGLKPYSMPQTVLKAFPIALQPQPNGTEPAETDWSDIGKLLRLRREAAGLSQPELGAKIGGVSASVISRLESSGTSPHLEAALAELAPELLPDAEVRELIGDNVQRIILHKAKAALLGATEGAH